MLKKLLMLCFALILSLSAGLAAAVEVNSADQAALESVKGIGPVHAKAIIDERTKNGPFKDADDLVTRVKGIGPKSVQNLEAAGLTINGSSAAPKGAPAKSSTAAKPATTAKPATAAPAATTPQTTAQSTPSAAPADAASGTTKTKKSKKSKADATASAATSASAPAMASDTTASKSKKSKKSKAASAASGA